MKIQSTIVAVALLAVAAAQASALPAMKFTPAAMPAISLAAQDKETVFWQSVRDSNDPDMYRAYLEAYPQGTFSSLARIRLEKLQSAAAVPGGGDDGTTAGECDRLAAYGNDYDRLAAAVSFGDLEKHATAAIRACLAAAKAAPDIPRLRFQLARAYAADGLEKQAVALFGKLAGEGYPAGLLMLGNIYSEGYFGVVQDRDKAKEYYKAAYKAGNPVAGLNLADLHYRGLSSHGEDEAAAFRLYTALESRLGNDFPLIYERLGYLYADGKGVAHDGRKAVANYEKAVRHEQGQAAYNLGQFYLEGRFVDRDLARAEQYFSKAVAYGVDKGLIRLAQLAFFKFDRSSRPYLPELARLQDALGTAKGTERLKIRRKLAEIDVRFNSDALNYLDETLGYIRQARDKGLALEQLDLSGDLTDDPYKYVAGHRRSFARRLRAARQRIDEMSLRLKEQKDCLKAVFADNARVYIKNTCDYDLNVYFRKANSDEVRGDIRGVIRIESHGRILYGRGMNRIEAVTHQCIPPRRPEKIANGAYVCRE